MAVVDLGTEAEEVSSAAIAHGLEPIVAVAPETAEVVEAALATNVEIEALVRKWLQNSPDTAYLLPL